MLLLLVISGLLTACAIATRQVELAGADLAGGAAGSGPEPPPAALVIAEQEQAAAIGTYCWTDLERGESTCADMIGIPTQPQPLVVSSPMTARIKLAIERAPDEINLSIIRVDPDDALPDADFGGFRWWPGQPGSDYPLPLVQQPWVNLDLEPGLYVLHAFVYWENLGDVSYGWLVEVQ